IKDGLGRHIGSCGPLNRNFLSKRVIAASILVIMNLFKRLAIDSALKKRKAQILAENDPNNG
ncbi:hypothetical protein, partial [Escherichia coli]|uniref:hypothetical protein n=1 Tax=Escherichia coli TaxID=562 RepID=UPI000761D461